MFGRNRFAASRFAQPGAPTPTPRRRRGVGGSGFGPNWFDLIETDEERRKRIEQAEELEIGALMAAGML